MKNTDVIIKILEVVGEGSSVLLLGRLNQDQWEYAVSRDGKAPAAPAQLQDPDTSQADVQWMPWSQAISVLDHYPWTHLSPLELHRKFRQPVLALVSERLNRSAWREPSQKWTRLARWLDLTDV